MRRVETHVAEETFRGRESGTVPPDEPGLGPGSNLAGHRHRTLCKPRYRTELPRIVRTNRKPSLSRCGEGSTRLRKQTETAPSSGGVVAVARKEGMCTRPVKPSWSQGESPWSKVALGDEAFEDEGATRRPEGGRWAHSSFEPLVTRRDPAKSRGAAAGGEPETAAKGAIAPKDASPAGRYCAEAMRQRSDNDKDVYRSAGTAEAHR